MRTLVVEDCPDTADSLALLLKMWGHEPRIAGNGLDALAMAETFRPDVVLLDIGLGEGLTGRDVARRLRDRNPLDPAVIIAVTGFGHRHKEEADEELFNFYFLKPVDPVLLQKLLEEVAKRRRPRPPVRDRCCCA